MITKYLESYLNSLVAKKCDWNLKLINDGKEIFY